MAYTITLIPGDGTGPEIATATRRAIDATGIAIDWEIQNAGAEAAEKEGGNPLPQRVIDSITRNKVALKGPITTPIGKGFRSVNVGLRQALSLYANVRPCKTHKGVRSKFENVDLVIVRENTEGMYSGIEFDIDTPETAELIATMHRLGRPRLRDDAAISIKVITRYASERIARFAFEYVRRNGRRKVTAVHKANIMKFSDGLFLDTANSVAQQFSDIEYEDRIVDNICMQLVQKPELYDILVMPNLYGDIVSDLAAGIVGGLGIAPGINIGEDGAVFEPIHGSAPKYAGQNKVNPMALMFCGALMLRHIGEIDAGNRLETALTDIIAEGKHVTYDMKPRPDDPTAVGTAQVADAVIERLQRG
ncbi:MAG: isocitrate/isopropylmalate dehydrogenase family protein [Chloroflexota bacterium]|nr:MAG: isocitrate/isopropylmalate dehydrogenase family protein [Chloroflexota bacterium]